jgi:hypothetical protein
MSSIKNNDPNNSESVFMALNLIYSLDKIAKCWVDVSDLVKPSYMTAPLK